MTSSPELHERMLWWLAVWIVGALALVGVYLRRRSSLGAGLTLAYAATFFMLHVPGAIAVIMPWSDPTDLAVTEAGLEQSSYGMLALLVGVLVAVGLRQDPPAQQATPVPGPGTPDDDEALRPGTCVTVGLLTYLLGRVLLNPIPGAAAVLSMAMFLAIAGLCLAWLKHWNAGRRRATLLLLGTAFCLPFGTMLIEGFMGFGAAMLLIVLAFVASFYRPRRAILVGAVVIVYFMLSMYVTYFRARERIRTSVWGGDTLVQRVSRIASEFAEFEMFNPWDPAHLTRVTERLNQNDLIGAAVFHTSVTGRYAKGETLVDAVLAIVPRALWPDKPVAAGGGHRVTEYTGIQFAEGTSVGMGQVFELYVNFGTMGVWIGMIVFGCVLMCVDAAAACALREGRTDRFLTMFLAGIGFIQGNGSFVEITASCIAGALVAAALVFVARARRTRAYPTAAHDDDAAALPGTLPRHS